MANPYGRAVGPAYFGITFTPRFRDLRGRWTRANKELLAIRKSEMEALGRKWVEYAQIEAPNKTGRFADTITYRLRLIEDGKNSEMSIMTYTAQPLGRWIVFGTRPHKIKAKHGPFLIFYWEKGFDGPGVYQFPQVSHPGTKKNPFHYRASQRWSQDDVRPALNRISQHWKISILGATGVTTESD